MRKGVDKRMISSQRRYKDDSWSKICSLPLSFTAGQYIYLNQQPMTKFAAERLTTESYSKVMSQRQDPLG